MPHAYPRYFSYNNQQRTISSFSLHAMSNGENTDSSLSKEQLFEENLENGKLGAAARLLQLSPNLISLENKERWNKLFKAIETSTSEALETVEQVNTRRIAEFPTESQTRNDMTLMYKTLKDLDQLRVFGAIDPQMPPAAGSHAVRPSLLEEITGLPLKALTPKPTNSLLLAGGIVAVAEGLLSVALNINLNVLVLWTLGLATADRIFLNGAASESFFKLFSPGIDSKIRHHEAGHFLCAYLLGCPVEGCVLNAWAALQDSRFGMGRQVTAGTSFFDPVLSQQINSPERKVTRSSIDRYSIIVMAGIAAEACYYQQADGGAGDEMALIAFLSQLNGSDASTLPPWNNVSIRNQARWGAMQAVLLLKEYKPCYEALVEALEKDGSLGDCIYAIEKAARDNNLGPLREPVGYIQELPGDVEIWTKDKPSESDDANYFGIVEPSSTASGSTQNVDKPKQSPEESLEMLNSYRKSLEERLKSIDEQLGNVDGNRN